RRALSLRGVASVRCSHSAPDTGAATIRGGCMNWSRRVRMALLPALAVFATVALAAPAAAQQGSVGGIVVAQSSGQPLAGASIELVGTTRGTMTNNEG